MVRGPQGQKEGAAERRAAMAAQPAMLATAWSAARQNACGRAHVPSVRGSKNVERTLVVESQEAVWKMDASAASRTAQKKTTATGIIRRLSKCAVPQKRGPPEVGVEWLARSARATPVQAEARVTTHVGGDTRGGAS